ncbi:MAG TPA: ATP-binding cassette domain-containing protein [Candidatus Dorea merdavium]|nr:ATP-binding cassette domain-containing protein [Candidatus Dorea merdavium]
MNDLLLKTENLCYTYEGNTSPALDRLDLSIRRGKRVACMGANGSGKSTFFLCCNGILRPDSGRILFAGQPLDYSRKGLLSLRSQVGIVFQDPDNQLFCASVFQEISFGPLNLGLDEATVRKRVSAVMDRLGITPYADRPVHALSGGQKKLVAIADILVMEPSLILLDEPVASLDPLHTQMVREVIDEIAGEGITVVTATHDVDYAWRWADEILLLGEGRLLAFGSPAEVFSREELLHRAGLTLPRILHLFRTLQQKEILPGSLSCPRTFQELERFL